MHYVFYVYKYLSGYLFNALDDTGKQNSHCLNFLCSWALLKIDVSLIILKHQWL